MQPHSLGELFAQPGFLTLLATILLVLANIMIGVSTLPRDGRKKLYKPHRICYFLVIAVYCGFLVFTYKPGAINILNYLVLVYFLLVVPIARRINVTLHAILASVGLTLLVLVAALTI